MLDNIFLSKWGYIPEGGKNIRENIQRARNIQDGTMNIMQLMIEEEPITTHMSSSIVKSGLDKLVGFKELAVYCTVISDSFLFISCQLLVFQDQKITIGGGI